MTQPIPDHLLKLPLITDEEIQDMIEKGEVHIEKRRILCAEAQKSLHAAFFSGIPVLLRMSLIHGDLDFTKGPRVSLENVEELSQELKEKMKKRSVEEVILVKAPLSITESFIKGRVLGSLHLLGGLSVIKGQILGDLDLRKSIVFPNVSFSYTQFGDTAHFGGVTFSEEANFEGATFDEKVYFEAATFGCGANFGDATFSEMARFTGATFGKRAKFIRANFGGGSNFGGATFGEKAFFSYATFRKGAIFKAAILGDGAYFAGATFGDIADFEAATFGEGASFVNASFQGSALFQGRKAQKDDKYKEEAKPIFDGEVDFRNVNLEVPEKVRFQHVNLSKAYFLETPLEEVNFIDVDWAKREGLKCVYDEIALEPREEKKNYPLIYDLYRQLKGNYENKWAYAHASHFHYGEMEITLKMHRAKKEYYDWFITRAYKFFSGYGELSGWAMYILFWVWVLPAVLAYMGQIMAAKTPPDFYNGLLESLLVSIKAMSLRLPEFPPTIIGKFVMIVQAILGPIQLALVALALRRKFRR